MMLSFTKPRPAGLTAAALALSLSSISAAAVAQTAQTADAMVVQVQFLQDIGASERINLSGKLRMLSQRMAAAGCYTAAGISPEVSGPLLSATTAEFMTILDALEFGDESLGIIGAEERRKTLVGLGKLRELFAPANETAAAIQAGDNAPETVALLAEQSLAILSIAEKLVTEVSAEYADPTALLQSDALTIDIAGRQRMLAQRMSKNLCLISSGITVDTAKANLAEVAALFETSLSALRNGMPEAGISEPPTAEVATDLDEVGEDWATLKATVERALAGESLTPEDAAAYLENTNEMAADLNHLVGQYSEASKLGL